MEWRDPQFDRQHNKLNDTGCFDKFVFENVDKFVGWVAYCVGENTIGTNAIRRKSLLWATFLYNFQKEH